MSRARKDRPGIERANGSPMASVPWTRPAAVDCVVRRYRLPTGSMITSGSSMYTSPSLQQATVYL